MKFLLVTLILIRVIAFIYDFLILYIVVKGTLRSNLSVKEGEAIIYTIIPLEMSLLEAILFLNLLTLKHGLYRL